MSKPVMGFGGTTRQGEDTEAVNRMFSPEFRNRLDAVIGFRGLTPKILDSVVGKFVQELAAQLADRRVHLEVDHLALAWLTEKGYDPQYGARPLARVIQEHIKRPLAEELLFGQLAKGGKVVVTIRDGKPAFDCTPAKTPALLAAPDDVDEIDVDVDDADDEAEFLPEPVA
jgi:ATP-dependent Clp protease ATP-binding subunit ClpA